LGKNGESYDYPPLTSPFIRDNLDWYTRATRSRQAKTPGILNETRDKRTQVSTTLVVDNLACNLPSPLVIRRSEKNPLRNHRCPPLRSRLAAPFPLVATNKPAETPDVALSAPLPPPKYPRLTLPPTPVTDQSRASQTPSCPLPHSAPATQPVRPAHTNVDRYCASHTSAQKQGGATKLVRQGHSPSKQPN